MFLNDSDAQDLVLMNAKVNTQMEPRDSRATEKLVHSKRSRAMKELEDQNLVLREAMQKSKQQMETLKKTQNLNEGEWETSYQYCFDF